ncbi:hypothetical protein INR49_002294 [Caranx melampygus]|nr:hypothetical protein INR49_002294 [Caranx melampygus]
MHRGHDNTTARTPDDTEKKYETCKRRTPVGQPTPGMCQFPVPFRKPCPEKESMTAVEQVGPAVTAVLYTPAEVGAADFQQAAGSVHVYRRKSVLPVTDMKLELLLVLLAVAVLAPGLTQGRIVSTCELKEKLGAALTLDQDLQKHKEHILAIVICEVTKWSHLNTSLINVEGERVAPTTARPTTAAKVTKHSTARPDETAAEAKKTAPKAVKPKTTKPKATKPTTAATTTLISTTDVPTTAEAETTETSQATSPASRRRKREDDDVEEEEEEVQMSEEVVKRMPWSLGHYGLFQLTDSHFCDSGFRWSRNKCNATCTDFADDDIADDIDCLVMSGYWR